MNKAEMIEDIETLIKANKDNDNCSVFWSSVNNLNTARYSGGGARS